MLAICVLVYIVFLKNSDCFNVDTNFPIVYTDPSEYLNLNSSISSYFGYSLVLYPGNRKEAPWILIGAPRARSPTIRSKNPGVCYKCEIQKKCSIQPIHEQSGILANNQREKLDNAWIGGSMDINYKFERVVMCAYRWINIVLKNPTNDYYMRGSCYWFHIDDKSNTTQRLLPLLEETTRNDIYKDGKGAAVYYYAQGEAGFSIHMPSNEKELLLGAPGVYNWDGTSILYKDSNDSVPEASRLRKTKRFANPNDFGSKNVANSIKTTQTSAYDLMGYSSTSGYFYNKKELYYVSGAPKSNNYKGLVLIYKFDDSGEKPLKVKDSRSGVQFGEYFGASVTAGDINNDGYDDLIVGAPFYKTSRYNEGKIYVFMGNDKFLSENPSIITGQHANGQFGTCIQYLGDINFDGFGDVAVAAPYEEEKSGVVYLYKGTRGGLDTTYSQRIVGRDISPNIKGFGISISRAVDMDFNKYSDFAIGAHLSGHVVLLRTRPTVSIYHQLHSFSPRLDYKEKSFRMSACFWYRLNQNDMQISIRRILTVDGQLGRARLESDNYIETIQLVENRMFCQNFTIILEESFLNKHDPITVSLAHEFLKEKENKEVVFVSETITGTDRFCPRCPVYDKYGSSIPVTVDIPFALNCGTDNICSSSLDFEPTLIGVGADNRFILGSTNYIKLQTVINNQGENAYLTQIVVTVPEIVNFQRTPSACVEQNASSVICSVDNPLQTNNQKIVTLDLDMTEVNSGQYDDNLIFTVMILTSSENNKENIKQLNLRLIREADVTISGKSEEQSYSYMDLGDGLPNFTQIYQMEKFGSSPLNKIRIEFDIPYAIASEDDTVEFISLYPLSGNLLDREIICTSNFSYIIDSNTDASISYEENSNNKKQKRSIEDVEVFNKSSTVKERMIIKENEFDKLQNRTFYINCSVPEVICSKILCTAGSIKLGQIATIKLKMLFNSSAIQSLLGKKDIILYSTRGSVTVVSPSNFVQTGNRPDYADVSSLFLGDSTEQSVELWIILAAVIAGLLLLLLLILGLIKAGFFKRTTKEELQQLKKEMESQQIVPLDEEEENEEP